MADDDGDEVTDAPDARPADPGRRPRVCIWLVVVATVLAIVSVLSTWVRTQALHTDTWVAMSDELLESEEVRATLAVVVVDVLYEEIDLGAELGDRLPEDLEGLGSPLAGVLRGPLTDSVELLLGSAVVRTAWTETNRAAHETLVRVLRDETREGLSTTDGTVTLELGELARVIAGRLGLSADALEGLPDDAGRVVIFESSELADVQAAVALLDIVSWFSFVLVVGLYALAVYLGGEHRVLVLRSVGIGLIVAGVVILLVRSIATRRLVDGLVENPANERAAQITGEIVTRLVREMAWSGIVYGVLIVAFALLLGDHRWAVAVRRTLSPALNSAPTTIAAGLVVLLIVLVWWSPGRAFQSWTTALTLVLLLVAAVLALRRRTMEEFPDVTTADVWASLRPTRSER